MPVTKQELKQILETPISKGQISEARRREELLRFHAKPDFVGYENPTALCDFLDRFLKEVVTNYDQYNLYRLMLQFPVDTNPLMSEVYGCLSKIFEGKDPAYNVEFLSATAEEDWMEFRREWQFDEFWRKIAWQEFTAYPESFIVVDLPVTQASTLPEPYAYFLKISQVIDYKERKEPGKWDELEWIIFRVDKTHLAFFDTTVYQIFETKENSVELVGEGVIVPHGLGYCPASKFVCGEHPAYRYLTKLKKLLFSQLGQDITDFSIANPVWWVYESDCDFENPETGDCCDGGFLKSKHGEYILRGGKLEPCPACKSRFRGHGTVLEIPVPDGDQKALGVPAGAITTPVESLEYGSKRVTERADEIYYGLVGYGSETPNDKAVNKQQVRSLQESSEDKLNALQPIFERAQTWAESTIARLRYGLNFVSLSISYGLTHFIEKAEDVLTQYNDAKTKGSSDNILDGLYSNYVLVKYKNNPEKLMYENIVWNLEPFRHRNITEIREMYRLGEVEFPDYYIKVNFSSLLARFERENISVLQFGSALSFAGKIEAIYNVLKSYAIAIQPAKKTVQPSGDGDGNFLQ